MSKHEKFLEFNGKKILFLSVDGTYWIALRPICEALNIDVRRSRDIAKNDPILAPEVSIQALQVEKNGKKQVRNMTCIREQFVYGWIFSLRSDSAELVDYKRTCYNLLFKHFHGTITNRKELLMLRKEVDTEIWKAEEKLKEEAKSYAALNLLKSKRKQISQKLNVMDKELIKEPELFN